MAVQDRLNGDIGTFGLRIEGDEFFQWPAHSDRPIEVDGERVARRLCELMWPYIKESLASAFELPPGLLERVDVSFEGWKPGSIEVQIAFHNSDMQMVGVGVLTSAGLPAPGAFKFFKGYPQFRKGVEKDLNDHGPAILQQVRRLHEVPTPADTTEDPEVHAKVDPITLTRSKKQKTRAGRSPK